MKRVKYPIKNLKGEVMIGCGSYSYYCINTKLSTSRIVPFSEEKDIVQHSDCEIAYNSEQRLNGERRGWES